MFKETTPALEPARPLGPKALASAFKFTSLGKMCFEHRERERERDRERERERERKRERERAGDKHLDLLLYLCIYIYIYIYIYVCICVFIHTCQYTRISACDYASMSVCIWCFGGRRACTAIIVPCCFATQLRLPSTPESTSRTPILTISLR